MCSNSLLSVYDKIYQHIPELYFQNCFPELELFYLCFSFMDSFKCFPIQEEKERKMMGYPTCLTGDDDSLQWQAPTIEKQPTFIGQVFMYRCKLHKKQ